jgi:hypothetical protein
VNHNLAGRWDGYFVDPTSGNLELTGAAKEALGKGRHCALCHGIFVRPFVKPRRISAHGSSREKRSVDRCDAEGARPFQRDRGTFAQFGDSITFSGAFWSPLALEPKNMSPGAKEAYRVVRDYTSRNASPKRALRSETKAP